MMRFAPLFVALAAASASDAAARWRELARLYDARGRLGLDAEKRAFVAGADAALKRSCDSDGGGGAVAAAEAKLVAAASAACARAGRGNGDGAGYRDLWCADAWDGVAPNARAFGHPPGMCYAGRRGSFLYVPVPKVATTGGRLWAAAAYGEERGPPRPWVLVTSAKPPADRLDGAALLRSIPDAVVAGAVAFGFVRDPLERFASGWRELRAYERGPPARRGWAKVSLRAQPFYENASRVHGAAAVGALFGSGDGGRPRAPALRDAVFADAVRALACDRDWNEHLTPQYAFFPPTFAGAIAPVEALAAVLPAAAAAANLSAATARTFAGDDGGGRPGVPASGGGRKNARRGWPAPEDVKGALAAGDGAGRDPPTAHVWCWVHARDYAAFGDYYPPPPWCAGAWRALGGGNPRFFA